MIAQVLPVNHPLTWIGVIVGIILGFSKCYDLWRRWRDDKAENFANVATDHVKNRLVVVAEQHDQIIRNQSRESEMISSLANAMAKQAEASTTMMLSIGKLAAEVEKMASLDATRYGELREAVREIAINLRGGGRVQT